MASTSAQAILMGFTAEIDTLQGGVGSPFAVGQQVTGTIFIDSLGADLAGSNALSVYSGVSTLNAAVNAAGFSATAAPGRVVSTASGGGAAQLPDGWGSVDGIVQTKNTANDDVLDIVIGFIDSQPRDYGGNASGTPGSISGKSLDGLSINVRDADGVLFDSLGQNPDPNSALQLVFANLGSGGLLDNNVLDRAEIRFHFTPDGGPNQPANITATLTEGAVVPGPAAVWLFGSAALLGLVGVARSRKTA